LGDAADTRDWSGRKVMSKIRIKISVDLNPFMKHDLLTAGASRWQGSLPLIKLTFLMGPADD
jgi:hypothetical protein